MLLNILALVLVYHGYCDAKIIERKYSIYQRDAKLTDTISTYKGISRLRCCDLCMNYKSCYYVSYDSIGKWCTLTLGRDAESSMVTSQGWNVYKADCPLPSDFATLENVSLAIAPCVESVDQDTANRRCKLNGHRLVMPDTQGKFNILRIYMQAFYASATEYFTDFWTDGKITVSGETRFSDNRDVPTTRMIYATYQAPNNRSGCLYMKKPEFKWEDGPCSDLKGYICERI